MNKEKLAGKIKLPPKTAVVSSIPHYGPSVGAFSFDSVSVAFPILAYVDELFLNLLASSVYVLCFRLGQVSPGKNYITFFFFMHMTTSTENETENC